MSIVCGIDFSRWSLAAMRFSAALAHRLNQELWLVHVVPLDAKESEKTQGTALSQGTHQLDALRASLAHLPVRVKTQSVTGPPSDALLEAAHRLDASLLVVGSAGHSDRPLGQLGGTSERIAAQGALPVVVVRDDESLARWTSGAPLRVLIGVDGSMSSAAAVRWVERLRAVAPVDVVLGQIYYADEAARHYGVSHSAPLEVADPQLESLLERDLRQRIPSLRGEGALVHRAKLGLGRIGDHLAEMARDERCQLIAVGTHGKRGIARWWSVSAAALHLSRTAVAVIPSEPEITSGAHQRLRHLLVSTDFSECGNAALPWAYDMAAP
ncbi:MAG: universal stress protein, partial [Archangium sp.]|nr:universal stress protein [Archangium sp.]